MLSSLQPHFTLHLQFLLTLSLPQCHVGTTTESAKFAVCKPFFSVLFFFSLLHVKGFAPKHSIRSRSESGERPENVLSAGMCVHFSARKLCRLGQ